MEFVKQPILFTITFYEISVFLSIQKGLFIKCGTSILLLYVCGLCGLIDNVEQRANSSFTKVKFHFESKNKSRKMMLIYTLTWQRNEITLVGQKLTVMSNVHS